MINQNHVMNEIRIQKWKIIENTEQNCRYLTPTEITQFQKKLPSAQFIHPVNVVHHFQFIIRNNIIPPQVPHRPSEKAEIVFQPSEKQMRQPTTTPSVPPVLHQKAKCGFIFPSSLCFGQIRRSVNEIVPLVVHLGTVPPLHISPDPTPDL